MFPQLHYLGRGVLHMRRFRVRALRLAIAASLALLLVGQGTAGARTLRQVTFAPWQVGVEAAQVLVGGTITGGHNVQVHLRRHLKPHKSQLVVNDCNVWPPPPVGVWVFQRSRITVLSCSLGLILKPKIPAPKDYRILTGMAIDKACRMMRNTVNHDRAPKNRVRFTCARSPQSLDTFVSYNPFTHTSGVSTVTLGYGCNKGHSHSRLAWVKLSNFGQSAGLLQKIWCDGTSRYYGIPRLYNLKWS
jgi:hypothetical protein